ncbi:hypothetical protein CEXT_410631, partial [Caerostris extrusa]
ILHQTLSQFRLTAGERQLEGAFAEGSKNTLSPDRLLPPADAQRSGVFEKTFCLNFNICHEMKEPETFAESHRAFYVTTSALCQTNWGATK